METHNKFMPKLVVMHQEKTIIEGLQSCGYQYDEVLQYLNNKQRFEMKIQEDGHGYTEYLLYDSYKRRAFILLATKTSVRNDYCGFTITIQSFQNKEVPFNYYR